VSGPPQRPRSGLVHASGRAFLFAPDRDEDRRRHLCQPAIIPCPGSRRPSVPRPSFGINRRPGGDNRTGFPGRESARPGPELGGERLYRPGGAGPPGWCACRGWCRAKAQDMLIRGRCRRSGGGPTGPRAGGRRGGRIFQTSQPGPGLRCGPKPRDFSPAAYPATTCPPNHVLARVFAMPMSRTTRRPEGLEGFWAIVLLEASAVLGAGDRRLVRVEPRKRCSTTRPGLVRRTGALSSAGGRRGHRRLLVDPDGPAADGRGPVANVTAQWRWDHAWPPAVGSAASSLETWL